MFGCNILCSDEVLLYVSETTEQPVASAEFLQITRDYSRYIVVFKRRVGGVQRQAKIAFGLLQKCFRGDKLAANTISRVAFPKSFLPQHVKALTDIGNHV